MKLSALTLPLLPALAAAQDPPAPNLSFLYSLNCTLGAPWNIGQTPFFHRNVIPITGGTFAGPRLAGTISDLGADWGRTDRNGVFSPDTRYNLATEDGENIYVQTTGAMQADGTALLRGLFEADEGGAYGWLNYAVAVGVLKAPAVGGYVLIDMWTLQVPDGKSTE